jgi:FixJ family two-component response regulator
MSQPANIVVCELEDGLATQLQSMLSALNGFRCDYQSIGHADVVFCGADPQALSRVLRAVEETQRTVPVVVVSQRADVSAWLDALEAGAADYLSAPFEAHQLDWVLQSQLSARQCRPHQVH